MRAIIKAPSNGCILSFCSAMKVAPRRRIGTVITSPTVLLDMDQTILRTVSASGLSTEEPLGHYHPDADNATPHHCIHNMMPRPSSFAVTETDEGFTVLRNVPWMHSGEWHASLRSCLLGAGPTTNPKGSDHYRSLSNHVNGLPPSLRRVDIILRPHLIAFLADLETRSPCAATGARSATTPVMTWRLCTANHPFNAIAVMRHIRRLLQLQAEDDLTSHNQWILERLSFATYSCQLCRRSKRHPADHTCVMSPHKSLKELLIPVAAEIAMNGGVSDGLLLEHALFTNGLLFDDAIDMFDRDDALCQKRCIPVRPFGATMQRVLPASRSEHIKGDGYRCDSCSAQHDASQATIPSLHEERESMQVIGSSSDDVSDTLFLLPTDGLQTDGLQGPPDVNSGPCEGRSLLDCDRSGGGGLAMQLIRTWVRASSSTAVPSFPSATPGDQYASLWNDAVADFAEDLDQLNNS
jgi:hypothetical protein